MAVYQTAMTLSFTIGPTLGGILYDIFGFRWMFILNAFLACVPFAGSSWLYFYHSEMFIQRRTHEQSQTRLWDVLTFETRLGALAWFLLYAGFAFETLLQEHLYKTLQCSPTDVGMIIFLQAITTLACVKQLGEYADRQDSRWLIPIAFFIAAIYHFIAGPPPILNYLFDGFWVMLSSSCFTLIAQGLVAGMLLPSAYSFIADSVMAPGVDGTEEQVAEIMVFLEGFGFTLSTMFAGLLMNVLPSSRAPNCFTGPQCQTPYAYVMQVYTGIFFFASIFLWRGLSQTRRRNSISSEAFSEL